MSNTDRPFDVVDGPWTGMLDSIAPTSKHVGKYLLGQNIYPLDPSIGDGVVGRPGVRVLGTQMGTVGRRRVQGLTQFTKTDGTEFTIAVVGGYFYSLSWAGETWAEIVTNAQLTAASITLSQTATVTFANFNNKLIVSDGINAPWAWDGTAGAGLTKLTNAPVFYGQQTVHQGRLFGINAADPSTMMWSEVDQPNTGYNAGGFTNAWTITQTDVHRLYRLVGANEGLYVFRAGSATIASGSVSTSFASLSDKEGVSQTVGTVSPLAVAYIDAGLIVLDADMHPQLLRPGAIGFTDIWSSFRETVKALPKTQAMLEKCMSVVYTPAQLVLIAVPSVGGTECSQLLVYDIKGNAPTPVAVWRGWEMTALSMVKNGSTSAMGFSVLTHGDTTGYVYVHGNPEDSSPWDDFLATGTVPVEHILETQALGYSAKRESIYDRIDLSIRSLSRMTLAVNVTSTRGKTTPQTIVVDSGIAGWDNALWDEMIWDVNVSLSTQEAHGDVGIDVEARWIKPRVYHSTLNERFGLVALAVTGYSFDDDPEVP